MVAMSSPWRDPRTGIFHVRRAVPKDLRPVLGWEYKRTLGTKDPKEAKAKFPLEQARAERLFAEERMKLHRRGDLPLRLSQDQIDQLAEVYLSELLEEDEEFRREGLSERDFGKLQETLEVVEAGEGYSLARGDTRLMDFEVEEFIENHDLNIPKDSPAFEQLAYALLKASVRATKMMLDRQRGEVVESPSARPMEEIVEGRPKEGDPISEIFEAWKAEKKTPDKTNREWATAIRRFTELHGDKAVQEITRRDVSRFKAALLKLPKRPTRAMRGMPITEVVKTMEAEPEIETLSPASVNKHLAAIQSVMNWAVRNGFRDDNPASRLLLKIDDGGSEERLPFEVEDLKSIFSSPVYTEGQRPRAGAGEAAFWLPLLALFSGARERELGQLLIRDLREEEGIHYVDINKDDPGKTLKSKHAKRKVPLHPELIRIGFLDFVKRRWQRDGDEIRLFSELRPDTTGNIVGNWSKWWNGRYLRKTVGITDPHKVFHSFRHTFKVASRASRVPEDVHDALTGHGDRARAVSRGYGGAYRSLLEVLAEYMDEIQFKGLNLSYLEWPQRWIDNTA